MQRTENWQQLVKVLKKIYAKKGKKAFEDDKKYLQEAFKSTEKWWWERFKEFDREHPIRLVILSEAPLFGKDKEKKYFYNPGAGATPFFCYEDYRKTFRSYEPKLVKVGTVSDRKCELYCALRERGVIVLDIFPFAFLPNKDNGDSSGTIFDYPSMSKGEYRHLLKESIKYYLGPKLRAICSKTRSMSELIFVYRYKRVKNTVGDILEGELTPIRLAKKLERVDSIYGESRFLDRQKLKKIYKKLYAA